MDIKKINNKLKIGFNNLSLFNDNNISKVKLFSTNKVNKLEVLDLDSEVKKEKKYFVEKDGSISLKSIHPELKEKMDELIEKCKEEGIEIKVTEDVRSSSRQNDLYNQGRNTSGNIVTNAKGSDYSSMHQWGLAFDVCINVVNEEYDEKKLRRVGEIGKSLGLEWGGDWKMEDTPHFQLKGDWNGVEDLKSKYENPGNFSDTC